MVKVGGKLTFTQALVGLGITGATNSISQCYTYGKGASSDIQRQLEHLGSGNWGIYADSQQAAKALAVVLGWSNPYEVHSFGMHGHYNDGTHTFRIWYGGTISY